VAAVGFGLGAMGAAYGAVGAGLRLLAWRTSALPESIADLLGWRTAAAAASMAVAAVSVAVVAARSVGSPTLVWSWWKTGLALGAVGVAAWLLGARAGWQWGLSVTGPARDLFEAIVFRRTQQLGFGAALLVGLPAGAWLSARCRGRVAWRLPALREVPRRLAGGVLMGAGGTLAGGCNIGNALTGLSILSTNSALATAGIALGVATAVYGPALASGRRDPVPAKGTR
jgi:hypothetical protein